MTSSLSSHIPLCTVLTHILGLFTENILHFLVLGNFNWQPTHFGLCCDSEDMLLFKIHEGGKEERLLDHWQQEYPSWTKHGALLMQVPVMKVPFKSPGNSSVLENEGVPPQVCPLSLGGAQKMHKAAFLRVCYTSR